MVPKVVDGGFVVVVPIKKFVLKIVDVGICVVEVLDCEEIDCVARVGNPNEGKINRNVVDGVDNVEVVGDNVDVKNVDVGVEKVEVDVDKVVGTKEVVDSLEVGILNGKVGAKNG